MSATVELMFNASTQANNGGVVRRAAWRIHAMGLLPEIIRRARANNFHVIETGGQIVLLCHEGDLVIHS